MDEETQTPDPAVRWEPEDEETVQAGTNATLDFFLTTTPEIKVFDEKEVPRLGLLFHLRALTEDEFQTAMKRSEKRQTKAEKRTGQPVDRDTAKLEKLLIVTACEWVAKRIMTDDEAKAAGKTKTVTVDGTEREIPWPYGPPVELNHEDILRVHGPRTEDVLEKWLLPGERTQLADLVTDVSGYGTDVLSDPVTAAGN